MTRRRSRDGKPWVLRWEDPPKSGRTHQDTIGPMSAALAEQHRELWQAELNGLLGDIDADGALPWADFVERYLASAATGLQPSTLSMYRLVLARFTRVCGPRTLAQVDRALVERYRISRAADVGPWTVRKDLRTLHAIFAWAVDMELLVSNPVIKVRSHGRISRPDPDALTPEQTTRFLKVIEQQPTWIHASLRLACLWGPRVGELAAIERADIDFSSGTLRIPVTGRRRTKEGRGKTVPLDADTAGLLQELSHRDGPLLWVPLKSGEAAGGGRRYRERLWKSASAVLLGLGIRPSDGKPMQFLRRTAETNMRRRGVPDWMVGAVLGHGTRVGLEFYSGVSGPEIAGQVLKLMGDSVTRA
jgi:integrase